jgi:hypothetical protein
MCRFFDSTVSQAVQRRYLSRKSEEDKYRGIVVQYFAAKTDLTMRKINEFPWQLRLLGRTSELLNFLTSDIRILTYLYTPLSKFDFFGYLQATGGMNFYKELFNSEFPKFPANLFPCSIGEGSFSLHIPIETVQIKGSLFGGICRNSLQGIF